MFTLFLQYFFLDLCLAIVASEFCGTFAPVQVDAVVSTSAAVKTRIGLAEILQFYLAHLSTVKSWTPAIQTISSNASATILTNLLVCALLALPHLTSSAVEAVWTQTINAIFAVSFACAAILAAVRFAWI